MATIFTDRPTTAALAVMREWSPADFRAIYHETFVEATLQRRLFSDKQNARFFLSNARMIREVAATLAPSRLP